MLILGDSLVPFEEFKLIENIDEISSSKPNSTLIFKYNEKILEHCFNNNLDCAVIVDSIKEAIYVNSLKGKYIISDKKISSQIQKIADNYMFDSKNIVIIDTNDEFESVANLEIDGVIYSSLIN